MSSSTRYGHDPKSMVKSGEPTRACQACSTMTPVLVLYRMLPLKEYKHYNYLGSTKACIQSTTCHQSAIPYAYRVSACTCVHPLSMFLPSCQPRLKAKRTCNFPSYRTFHYSATSHITEPIPHSSLASFRRRQQAVVAGRIDLLKLWEGHHHMPHHVTSCASYLTHKDTQQPNIHT